MRRPMAWHGEADGAKIVRRSERALDTLGTVEGHGVGHRVIGGVGAELGIAAPR